MNSWMFLNSISMITTFLNRYNRKIFRCSNAINVADSIWIILQTRYSMVFTWIFFWSSFFTDWIYCNEKNTMTVGNSDGMIVLRTITLTLTSLHKNTYWNDWKNALYSIYVDPIDRSRPNNGPSNTWSLYEDSWSWKFVHPLPLPLCYYSIDNIFLIILLAWLALSYSLLVTVRPSHCDMIGCSIPCFDLIGRHLLGLALIGRLPAIDVSHLESVDRYWPCVVHVPFPLSVRITFLFANTLQYPVFAFDLLCIIV